MVFASLLFPQVPFATIGRSTLPLFFDSRTLFFTAAISGVNDNVNDRTLKGSEETLLQVGEGRHYVKERKRLRCICFRVNASSHKSERIHQDASESVKKEGIKGNLGSRMARTTKVANGKLRKETVNSE